MTLLNKIIYYNDSMYKIVRTTKSYFYIHKLTMDQELILNVKKQHYYKLLPHIDEEILRHYTQTLSNIDKQIKIKKTKLQNYIIVNNIDNMYIHNKELKNDYCEKWKTPLFIDVDIIFYIKYSIYLFDNEYLKINKKEWREDKLIFFVHFINLIKKECNTNDIDITKNLNLYDKYLSIFEEYKYIILRDKKIINNCSCCICLSNDIIQYSGFYKCNHFFCYNCYDNWNNINKNSCPICRSS